MASGTHGEDGNRDGGDWEKRGHEWHECEARPVVDHHAASPGADGIA